MALLPDVHVNLDRPTIQHIYQLFLPIIPGGALVIGLLLTHPDYMTHFAVAQIIGTVFVAYAAGLMLFVLSTHFAGMLSLSVAVHCNKNPKRRPSRENMSISQNFVWRRVATAFLGDKLAPPLQVDPNLQQVNDQIWNDWYNVLQDYVLRSAPALAPDVYFLFTTVQATAWAIVFTSAYSTLAKRHPVALSVVVLLLIVTALAPFGANYWYRKYDRLNATDLVARLLAETRARGDAVAPPKTP